MSNILVTGATGHLGSIVVAELLKRTAAGNLSVLVRDPAKAAAWQEKGVKVLTGNYNDYDSLVAAFQHVDRLYFISGNEIADRLQQHENVVKAAVAAKVGHVFYTSFQRKTEDGTSAIQVVADSHLKTEAALKASGLTYTFLLHTLYADMLPVFMGAKVLDTGIFLPARDGKVAYATRQDMGEAGAILLLGTGHENKAYDLAAGITYSFGDIAKILSELSGKEIQYISPSGADFIAKLTELGVPGEMAQITAAFCEGIAKGEFDLPDNTLESILGRKPTELKAFLKTAYGL